MVKKATIVEINGRQYDAITGKLIAPAAQAAPITSAKPRTIDGFSSHINGTHPARPQAKNAHDMHQVTRKSQKLHPAVVKNAQQKMVQKNNTTSSHKTASLVEARLKRAQTHQKSAQITKFSGSNLRAPAPVKQALLPEEKIAAYQPPAIKAVTQPSASPEEVIQRIAPQASIKSGSEKKKRKFALVPAIAVLAVIVLGAGYLTYVNMPNFALKVASSRAGIDGSLPGYKPEGFSFDGPIAYAPGQLTLKFAGNSGEYQISQRESSWDSQSLLDNFVVRENKDYLTFQERGLTVYIYDNNQAAWVDGGIWYTIEGSSSLTNEQILKIASSL